MLLVVGARRTMELLALTHRLTFDIPKSSVFLRTLKSLSVCFDSQRSLLLHARNRRFVAVDSLVGLIPQTALDHFGLCSYNRPCMKFYGVSAFAKIIDVYCIIIISFVVR